MLLGVFAVLLTFSEAHADENARCIALRDDQGGYVEIRLRRFPAHKKCVHPVPGEHTSYVLVLDRAQCFVDRGEDMEGNFRTRIFEDVTHVQITRAISASDIGSPIEVTGLGFLGHTAWHVTNVLLEVNSIRQLPLSP